MSVRSIALKEVRGIYKEKTLVLMFLIQLFIAAFVGFLVVGIFSYFSPEALGERYLQGADLAVVVSDADHELIGYLSRAPGLRVYTTPEFSTAMEAFYDGRVDGVLVVPEEDAQGSKPIKLDLYLPKTELEATVLATAMKRPLQRYESSVRKLRVHRVSPEFREVLSFDPGLPRPERSSSYFEFVYGVLIPLLLITPALVSGGLIIDLLTEELERKTLQMLLASPLSMGSILDGKALVAVPLAPAQSMLWMYLLELNGIQVLSKGAVLVFIAGISLLMVCCGAALALHYEKRGTAHFVYSLFLINLFLASMAVPWISPLGVITRLGLGSSDVQSLALFAAYPALAVVGYLLLRRWSAGRELKSL